MISALRSRAGRIKRAAGRAVEGYAYHAFHKDQAHQLIASMTTLGGRQKDSAILRRCDEYARDVLGSARYSPWLKAYAVFAGAFKEGWIPDNYYGAVVVPAVQGGYGDLSLVKAVSRRLFQTESLPDLAYAFNGLLCTADNEPIAPADLKSYLLRRSEKVVYKPDGGGQGQGVFVYDARNFPAAATSFRNGVFQKYIDQHPFFSAFCGQSVSTIRVTTVVGDDSVVSCRAAYLRLPRRTDTHVRSATAIKVAVEIRTGGLAEKGYLPNWVAVARHPDSGQPFAGQKVPGLGQCVDLCLSLHKTMPFSRTIGWDVIVDRDGEVAVMEWNGGHNDIKFSEAAGGPCFADLNWQNLWRESA